MEDLAARLPSYFGIKNERAVKERGFYLLGAGKIHKSGFKPREILARFNLLRRLDEAGFYYTDRIIPAASGEPFVALGRDIFVMTRHVPGREPNLNSAEDMRLIMETLAKFHAAARGVFEKEIDASPPLTEIFSKQIAAANTIIKQTGRRARMSDFDMLVLKHAETFIAEADTALKSLTETDYEILHTEAVKNGHICHNNLKEEVFSISDGDCYITRYEETDIGLQLADVASVLRRYARKSTREIPAAQLLDTYAQILPLSPSAEKIILAQLSFPWPFFKLISQCYHKKRAFVPAAITSRMTEILREREGYDAYVSGLNT